MTREEAIRILASSCISGSKQTEALETLIPELRESEDERIRKDIINLIYWLKGNPSLCSQYYKDRYDGILTWLEKQKKQKQEWSESDKQNINLIISYLDSYIKEHNDTFGADECKSLKYWLKSIRPNQSKSEWSEEDEDIINLMIAILRENYSNCLFKTNSANTIRMSAISTDMLIKRIEALRPQPKQEWNDEDERKRDGIIQWLREYQREFNPKYDSLSIESIESLIDWLKSLRPSWKPSEEQDYSLYHQAYPHLF